MPVEIIVDNWNPRGRRKYRFETFCYGPLSCKLYKAGPNRKVEGRGGMVYVEEDWVDEANVAHREMDEKLINKYGNNQASIYASDRRS